MAKSIQVLDRIEPIEYAKKDGTKEVMKKCIFARMNVSELTGKILPALVNGVFSENFFPMRFDRDNNLVEDKQYTDIDAYLKDETPIYTRRFSVEPFNFIGDDIGAPTRNSITVGVLADLSTTSEADLFKMQLSKALYALRKLGKRIFDAEGTILGTSTTEAENALRVAAYEKARADRAKLAAGTTPIKTEKPETKAEKKARLEKELAEA